MDDTDSLLRHVVVGDEVVRYCSGDRDVPTRDGSDQARGTPLEPGHGRSDFVYMQHDRHVGEPEHPNHWQGRDTGYVEEVWFPATKRQPLPSGSDPGATPGERFYDVLGCQSAWQRSRDPSVAQHDRRAEAPRRVSERPAGPRHYPHRPLALDALEDVERQPGRAAER